MHVDVNIVIVKFQKGDITRKLDEQLSDYWKTKFDIHSVT